MKRIMVADDDKGIVEVLSMILENGGYEVKSTANGQTVPRIGEYLPDLVLLDIWMVGIDGRDICKYLKNQKLTENIPIIMISANKDIEKIAKDAGADDFIPKPFDMDNLLEKVGKYVGK